MSKTWKEIYNENKKRKYCEITGIKKEDVEIISNSYAVVKEKKILITIISLIFTGLLIYAFRSNIKTLLIVFAFFALAGVGFFVFNYYKLKCTKDGLYVRFGMQEGIFPYDRVKSVYLARFNDYNIVIPSKTYSIVIRYEDTNNRIKELSFPNYFISKKELVEFIENFNIKEAEEKKFVYIERFKILKRVAKIVGFTFLVLVALALVIKP